jgi:hypothetical protein
MTARPTMARYAHFGARSWFAGESALRMGVRGELGMVRVGDHLDDGESHSVAAVVLGSGAAEP